MVNWPHAVSPAAAVPLCTSPARNSPALAAAEFASLLPPSPDTPEASHATNLAAQLCVSLTRPTRQRPQSRDPHKEKEQSTAAARQPKPRAFLNPRAPCPERLGSFSAHPGQDEIQSSGPGLSSGRGRRVWSGGRARNLLGSRGAGFVEWVGPAGHRNLSSSTHPPAPGPPKGGCFVELGGPC